MYETRMSAQTTNSGNHYKIPNSIDDVKFYKLMYKFVNLEKVKGLTIRQAQYLFEACSDYVLKNKLV